MAEMPRFAHFVALFFLGSGFLTLVCLVVALVALLARAFRIAKLASAGAAVVVLGYAAILLGVALASPNRTLQAGGWKYFCEADCHIAYSVDAVQFASTLGSETKPLTAQGRFAVVRLKTWFDEHSIAPWRGNSPLTPNPRTVQVIDEARHRYFVLPAAVAVLNASSTPMDQPLRPGDSYTTTFVFDLPAGIRNPKLLISDVDPISRLLVDHENSPLHGKIYLALENGFPVSAANQ